MFLQKAFLCKLHGKREAGLAAETGEDAVRLFFFDDALDGGQRKRLDVNVVRHGVIRHDGRRVGVDQDDLKAILLEHLAGLGAGVVELAGLANNNGARTDNEDALDVSTFRHVSSPRSQRSRTQQSSSRQGGPSRYRCPGSSPRRP